MSNDIATISLRVNTGGLVQGNQELDKFADKAGQAALSADKLSDSQKESYKAFMDTARSVSETHRRVNEARAKFLETEQSQRKLTKSTEEQTKELQALLNKISPVNKALDELDNIQDSLSKFRGRGMVADEAFTRYNSVLETTRAKLAQVMEAETAEGRARIEQAQAAQRAAASAKTFISSLEEQTAAIGKTRAEILELKAAQLGVSQQAAPMLAKLKEQENAWKNGAISAGQYRNAMRYLPMHMTDVVTSIASGMPIYMVAIQQGGQLRDSFGGVGNALKAVTSLITPVRIAIGGLIGTLALMGAAAFKSSEQFDRAASSVLLMGGAGFKSLEQLNSVAARVASETGNSVSEVTDTLIDLNNQGKASGPEMERIAKAMLVMKDAGIDTKDSMADFGKILKDPIKGLAELNEKYGFLTEAEMKHLIQLKQTKGEQAAVTEAVSLYAGVMEERSNKVVEATDNIGRAWKTVKTDASNVFEQIGVTLRAWANQVIDIFELVKASINDLFLNITSLDAKFTGTIAGWAEKIPGGGALANFLGMDVAAMKKAGADAGKEIEANKKRYDILWKRITAPNAQANYEAEARGSGVTGDGGTNRESRSAVSKLADESERKVRADRISIDAATRMLQESRQRLAVLRQQSVQTESMTDGEKRLLAFNQQIADLKEKRILTADDKSVLARSSEIKSALELEASESRRLKQAQEIAKLHEQAVKYSQQIDARASALLDSAGLSDREASRNREREQLKLANFSPEDYDAASQKLEDYYSKEDALRGDWLSGAKKGWAEYQDSATNVYASMQNVAQSTLSGISGMLTDLVTTGKASFKSFAASMMKMIADVVNRLLVAYAVQAAMGWISGGSSFSSTGLNDGTKGIPMPPKLAWDGGYIPEFANGGMVGYTGDGGKYQPKGIVHGGEFVFTKEATSSIGVENLYAMMKGAQGYANGGFVGRAPMYGLSSNTGAGNAAPVINTTVNVDANGGVATSTSSDGDAMARALAKQINDQAKMIVLNELKPAGAIYNYINKR